MFNHKVSFIFIFFRPNSTIHLNFEEFATECNWDNLYVYDGKSVKSPLIAVIRYMLCIWGFYKWCTPWKGFGGAELFFGTTQDSHYTMSCRFSHKSADFFMCCINDYVLMVKIRQNLFSCQYLVKCPANSITLHITQHLCYMYCEIVDGQAVKALDLKIFCLRKRKGESKRKVAIQWLLKCL